MSYINTYWLDCAEEVVYDPAPCIDFEFGKVRWAAFIRKRYLPNLLNDPGNPDVWHAGIEQGDIFVIPKVSGSFDPGEPVALKGYGRRLSTRGPREMVLTFSDPSFARNYTFYDRIHRRTDLVPAFRTSNHVHIAYSPADIFGRDEVEEDLQSTVDWDVRCTWRGINLPRLVDSSTLGEIIDYKSPERSIVWGEENGEIILGTEEGFVFGNE